MAEEGLYCQLLSGSGLHSPIDLSNGTLVSVGRDPVTKIKSRKCSRRQVELTADFYLKEVSLKVVGKNPSIVANNKLKKGSKYVFGSGGKFDLITGYTYHIFFGNKVPWDNFSDSEQYSCEEGQMSKRMKIDHFVAGPSKVEHHTLVVCKYGPQCTSERIAAFDLDSTLIKTASGKKFASDYADWKLLPRVKPKLDELHKTGYKIVIFSNQGGIPRGKPTKEDFTKKITAVAEVLRVPLLVLAASGQDIYRKPCIGMWSYMVENENQNIIPNMSCSFFVGDAAGRLANWKTGAKKDFSCTDRKFASNIGLAFETPEEFFLGYPKCNKFSFGEFDPRTSVVSAYSPKADPDNALLTLNQPEVVVFVGFPASGKTTFYEKIMKPKGYVHVNRDILSSWQRCVNMCQQELKKRQKVVIDNTNPDVESRKRYIICAQSYGVPVRCFQFMTTIAEAKHNNRFRELTVTSSYTKVTEIAYNTFKSRFTPPNIAEGFKEIVKITLNASVENEQANLYQQFLL